MIESKKNVTSNVGSSSLSSKNVGDSISPPAADIDRNSVSEAEGTVILQLFKPVSILS